MDTKILLMGGLLLIIGISAGSLLTLLFQREASPLQRLTDYDYSVASKFVAVDEQGKGVVADLITGVREGQGLVLVNINNVLADVSTQYSARLATAVASNYTKIDVRNLDIIYNLKSDASVVAGQSAGSLMAVSTIAALQHKQLNSDVIITGSINAHGDLVDAGGIQAKATAAKQADARLLLVPKGSGSIMLNLTRTQRCMPYEGKQHCIIAYPGELVSIGNDIGIEVIEVGTIAEAVGHFL